MKKVIFLSIFVFVIFVKSSHALDGQGTIEEILTCGTGDTRWKQILMYRLSDGNWFGVYADWKGENAAQEAYARESNTDTSLVLLAFTSGKAVQVRANYSVHTGCGHTVHMTWNTKDDYIKIID